MCTKKLHLEGAVLFWYPAPAATRRASPSRWGWNGQRWPTRAAKPQSRTAPIDSSASVAVTWTEAARSSSSRGASSAP